MSLFLAFTRKTSWPALWLAACCLLVSPFALANTPLSTQDAEVLAGTCFNCHGPNGQSSESIPKLQGQPADRLLLRMQEFKMGKAKDATVMTRLMKGYDDAQLQALAEWFAHRGEQ